jgi:lipoprotein-anchoring transpeptidase ErfK/SrfK
MAPVAPAIVAFTYDFPANSIVIDTEGRKLYYVLGEQKAYAYPISVGREGFSWTGAEPISRKQSWPDWYPPAEMRERDPKVPEKMTGGLRNPLGAMALYLGNTLYRIHGTNDVTSIGHAQSSGCFRMLNSGVLHLASLANVGSQVTVVKSLASTPSVSTGNKTAETVRPKPRDGEISTPPAEPRATASQHDNKDRDYADLRARILEH